MAKTLLAAAVAIVALLILAWLVRTVGRWAIRRGRERRIAAAEKHATWLPYRRVSEHGEWEIGCERRWKGTVLQEIPRAIAPLETDTEELLQLEGRAVADAIVLNMETR